MSARLHAWAVAIAALAVTLATACTPIRPPTSPAPSVDLAIVTWNMHAGAGDLPRLVSDITAGRLTGGPPAGFTLLLQEVFGEQFRGLDAFAGSDLSVAFEPVRNLRGRMLGNAIVSTRPLAMTQAIALPRERQPRTALLATITVARQPLFVVNAHFENRVGLWRGLVFGDTARGRQARALVDALPSGPGIAGGDLNTSLGPSEPAWRVFAARFPDTPVGRWEPTFRDRLVLDHLFFDVPEGWNVTRRVLADRYGSDHRPVLGTVSASSAAPASGARRPPSPGRSS